jgi:hypothetical protein
VGTYSEGNLFVVYEMSRQVFPTAPSPTTTHLRSLADEGKGRGRENILDGSDDHFDTGMVEGRVFVRLEEDLWETKREEEKLWSGLNGATRRVWSLDGLVSIHGLVLA